MRRPSPAWDLINTSRGALIDTPTLVAALKQGHVGAAGLDVYEEEAGIFFSDPSDQVLASVAAFERGEALVYEVRAADVLR